MKVIGQWPRVTERLRFNNKIIKCNPSCFSYLHQQDSSIIIVNSAGKNCNIQTRFKKKFLVKPKDNRRNKKILEELESLVSTGTT